MDKRTSIFDETFVDCNTCGNYWNDSCDGLPIDRVKHCNSYKAMRMMDIPEEIKALQKEIKFVRTTLICVIVGMILLGGVAYIV